VMLVLLIATLFITAQAGRKYAALYAAEENNIRIEVDKGARERTEFETTQGAHTEVADNVTKLAKVFGQRAYWLDFMARLNSIKPPEYVITDLQLEHDGRVTITGLSQDQVAAAFFRDALKAQLQNELRPLPDNTSPDPIIDAIGDERRPPPPFTAPASRSRIIFQLKTKFNQLQITPTPAPAPAGGAPAAGRPGANRGAPPGGEFAF